MYTNRLIHTVEKTIKTYNMFQERDAVLIGVSGGPDSVALLYVLLILAPRYALKLGIAHLNHCLRGINADTDAAFVESLAKKLKIPYYSTKEDIRIYGHIHRLSLEEAGRQARYTFFRKVVTVNHFDKIALGHQADDNAELILMQLVRGSGLSGMSGIPPVRDGNIVRPLIQASRCDILDFLTKNKIEYVTDSSNEDIQYVRNRTRHELIPMLKANYNPAITETLNRLARIMRDEDEWAEEILEPMFNSCVAFVDDGKIALILKPFEKLHISPKRRIIRRAIARIKGDLRQITFAHVESVIHLLKNCADGKKLDLPGHIRVEQKGGHLIFFKESLPISRHFPHKRGGKMSLSEGMWSYNISKPGIIHIIETGDILIFSEMAMAVVTDLKICDSHIAMLDKSRAYFPIIVRNFRAGDRFTPLGISGTQKLKKYFIDHKISKDMRARCPIVLSDNRIIWVAGYRIDDSAKVTSSTKTVLKIELISDLRLVSNRKS